MESIKIKRRISSSTLRIKELNKFLNKNVQITITPINKVGKILNELLNISQWDINEDPLLSENALLKDWNSDKEDAAWDYLQKTQ